MHPIFLELGNLTIRWYGIMAAAGFLTAALLIHLNRKKAGMNQDQAATLVFLAVICGIVGSRIFYVIRFWSQFRDNFWEIVRIDHGGLVFYGGFFLTLIGITIYCRKQQLSIIRVMDVCAPALAAGHALGRIGCFLNGCCYGNPTKSIFGVTYPESSEIFARYGDVAVHPVQLYEAIANIVLAIGLFYLARHAWRGIAMSTYIILYGVIRFIDEFFRGDHQQVLADELLSGSQIISLCIIPIGIMLLYYFWINEKKTIPTDC